MDLLHHLALGFGLAISPLNLGFCLLGCLLGTLIGVLPGIGPIATIAMLLPITYGMPPVTSLIMLAGIYYGAQYGGSTTAILVNLPGEASAVVTCIDGYQMARKGRAGAALATAALGSFFAGCVGTVFLAAFAPALAAFSNKFASPEYCSLMALGLVSAVVLARGSVLKASAAVFLGLLLGMIGTDVTSGVPRYVFGIPDFYDGMNFLPLALGLFGFAEMMGNLENPAGDRTVVTQKITRLWPNREEFHRAWPAVLRGTGLGSLLGILPGGGAVLAAFASYTLEKKIAKDPSRFGNGAIEGVAGPESANNAGAQTSFIPLLTLGLPATPVMALMMGAMIIQGMAPGTLLIKERPDLFWGMTASMWLGNLMLVIINLPLIGMWVKLLQVPYRLLFPCILLFICVGVYSIHSSTFEVMLTAICAIGGYFFAKLGIEGAPLLLGFILGPLMEENLRRTLVISNGDPSVFLTRPISLALLLFAVFLLGLIILPQVRTTREEAFQE
jgi:TctA family transporter